MKLNKQSVEKLTTFINDENSRTQAIELSSLFRRRIFSFREVSDNTRVITHWRDKGLLISDTNTHRYSFIEYIWIKAIESLREFGCSLEIIENVKKEILHIIPHKFQSNAIEGIIKRIKQVSNDKFDERDIRKMLEENFVQNHLNEISPMVIDGLITCAIINREETGFFVFSDGEVKAYMNSIALPFDPFISTHLYISISELIQLFAVNPSNRKRLDTLNIFSVKELKIIQALRSKDVSKIEITSMAGDQHKILIKKGKRVIAAERESIEKKLFSKGYKNITVSTRDSGEFYIESSKSEKM